MSLTLSENGTDIDRMLAPLVNAVFPDYEKIWSVYIGCETGVNKITQAKTIPGINRDVDILRRIVGQYNYSVLLNYLHLDELSDNIPDYETKTFTALERIYILSVNLYYNAIEGIGKVYLQFKTSRSSQFMTNIRILRNMIDHELRPLIYLESKKYKVLNPEAIVTIGPYEKDKFIWSELNQNRSDYIELSKFIDRLKLDLASEFQILLGVEISKFKELKIPTILPPISPLTSKTIPYISQRPPTPSASIPEDE